MIRLAAIALLLSCCTHAAPVDDPLTRWQQQTRGMPVHVWRTYDLGDDGEMCQPYWLQPATLCIGARDLRYDCDWHCVDLVMMETP